MFALSLFAALAVMAPVNGRIHSVEDISHDFTFYMDGRFYGQYIAPNGADARNWGTLWKLNLSDTNLLVLSSGDSPIRYDWRAIEHIKKYVRDGGALLITADNVGYKPGQPFHIQNVAK